MWLIYKTDIKLLFLPIIIYGVVHSRSAVVETNSFRENSQVEAFWQWLAYLSPPVSKKKKENRNKVMFLP